MKTASLSPIYLNDRPVHLMGDPWPQVAKIVAASGKRPAGLQVSRLRSGAGGKGRSLRLEEVIDRIADPTQPIYLVSREKPSPAAAESLALPGQAPHGWLGPMNPAGAAKAA